LLTILNTLSKLRNNVIYKKEIFRKHAPKIKKKIEMKNSEDIFLWIAEQKYQEFKTQD
jgi:hypothetical protein